MAKNHKKKHIILLIIATAVSILLSGLIEYWLPEYSNMDFNYYREMAEAAPLLNTNVMQPFVYRILAPWLAGILPFNLDVNFYLLNSISLIVLAILFFEFLLKNKITPTVGLIVTIGFIFNKYFFQYLSWDYFHLTDTISLILILLSLKYLIKRKWFKLGLVFFIGALTKEILVLMIPTGYVYLWMKKRSKKRILKFTLSAIAFIVPFVIIRLLIQPNGGEDLFTQFSTGISRFFTPEAFIKKLIIAFTPFGLIPLLFWKDIVEFFRDRIYLLVYFALVFITTIFGDFERLMTPAAPVFYLFISYIINNYLKTDTFGKVFYYVFVSLVFLSSFYHLWGVVRLPGSDASIISTIVFSLLMAILFLRLKYQKSYLIKF